VIEWERTKQIEGSMRQALEDAGMPDRYVETTLKRVRDLAKYVASHVPEERGKYSRAMERIAKRLADGLRQEIDDEVLAYFRRTTGPKPPVTRKETEPKSHQGRHARKISDRLRAHAEAEGRL
jgi:hypothetical protein